MRHRCNLLILVACFSLSSARLVAEQPPQISFREEADRLLINLGEVTIAEYVFVDEHVLRPYIRHLKTPSGVQVTRNHPPTAGDIDDHPTMHPGLWLAFGELGGGDFWRNKGRVRHERFTAPPRDVPGRGSFTASNLYELDEQPLCREERRIEIEATPRGYLLRWTSTFTPTAGEIAFGDQEEMGLGVRVATPLAVRRGQGGEIVDSEGRRNEAEIWGRQSNWCVYRGEIDGRHVGIALLPHPDNFGRSWYHARDYGLLVANPFGRRAFTKGEPSRVAVTPNDPLTLRFGVYVYEAAMGEAVDLNAVYQGRSAR